MKIEGKKQIWKDYQKEIADDHYFYVKKLCPQNFFPRFRKRPSSDPERRTLKDIYKNASQPHVPALAITATSFLSPLQ